MLHLVELHEDWGSYAWHCCSVASSGSAFVGTDSHNMVSCDLVSYYNSYKDEYIECIVGPAVADMIAAYALHPYVMWGT